MIHEPENLRTSNKYNNYINKGNNGQKFANFEGSNYSNVDWNLIYKNWKLLYDKFKNTRRCENSKLSKYRMLRLRYLKENKKAEYTSLFMDKKLQNYLVKIHKKDLIY